MKTYILRFVFIDGSITEFENVEDFSITKDDSFLYEIKVKGKHFFTFVNANKVLYCEQV